MLNIKVIAKQAAFYTLTVIIIGGLITALNYLDSWLKGYPSFPRWILTLISASLVVIMGIIIWYHLRKEDILKYEMITTIAHRFRTPLTRIKWAVDNLLKSNLDKLSLEQVEQIKISNLKLIELTNFLSKIPEWEKSARYYNFQESNFSKVAEEAIDYLTNQAKRKNLTIIKKIQDNLKAVFDVEKIKFVIHILADNAINYTPQNGTITFLVYQKEGNIICEIKDTGIGIPKEDLLLLFSKFYRGKLARSIDTEGLGIGLYLAKEIINHHKGKIWVESEGLNKGSTFKFSIKSIK
jgi:signal transduction histidine kinase